ncbi:MAG: putative porin [Pseudomonadota bacterium]|nr:putative porin [Pseudomonadota bacterium]
MSTPRARVLLAAIGLATGFSAFAAPANSVASEPGGWKFSGDLRGGWFASERTARDGTESEQDAFNARLRMAIERSLGDRWTVRTRLAGRYSSDQDGNNAYLRGYAPTRTGIAFGDTTVDEAYLGYQAPDNGLRVKVGRFQTAFAVPGVASKGLDRNDSPNIDVNWTDGIHVDMPVAGGWRGHVIGQYRHRLGSGAVAHAPLDFSDDGSRTTVFLGLENRQRLGPITQRMVSVTWMPDSLAAYGLANAARDDYTAVDARIAAEWPLREGGARFVAGAEVAYALETPLDTVVGTGGSGETGGLAWQLQASVYDFAPRHHIGLAVGRADAGWLLSPDYRPNDSSAEIRYQWQFRPTTSMEARVRERRELDHPETTRERVDRDIYIRLTHKF